MGLPKVIGGVNIEDSQPANANTYVKKKARGANSENVIVSAGDLILRDSLVSNIDSKEQVNEAPNGKGKPIRHESEFVLG